MRTMLALVCGAVLGTGLRLFTDIIWPHRVNEFPISILLVNLFGSFVLALLVGTVFRKSGLPHWLHTGLGVGLLGSFTTMSAIMVGIVQLVQNNQAWLAALYLVLSTILGLASAAIGLWLSFNPNKDKF